MPQVGFKVVNQGNTKAINNVTPYLASTNDVFKLRKEVICKSAKKT